MKTLTPEITRAIVEVVCPLHLPLYDRNELHELMWGEVLNYAHYAGFDTSEKLEEINATIEYEWLKLKITPLEEAREISNDTDSFFGGKQWAAQFEDNLQAVLAI